jgi:hypothetical protein
MNWKLILQLSLFGLAMAVGTVFVIPSNIEPLFWLVIFVICAYVIATKAPGRYFLHGLMTSIVNSIWITAVHVILFDTYMANHPREAAMMTKLPLSPKVMMLCTGPIIGVISGLVLGLFAVIARKIVARRSPRL